MVKRLGSHPCFHLRVLCGLLLGVVMVPLFPSASLAIPAFARKYDLSCSSCHTKPPRLNAFGEAFHMAGFQIPTVREGETKEKRNIGRVWSETDFLNIFAFRANGNIVESFQGISPGETNLSFPVEAEIYLAGTFTDEISYFFELDHDSRAVQGLPGGLFEETSEFGIGKEFFLMVDLQPGLRTLLGKSGETMTGMAHGDGGTGRAMLMGPMVMIGKIDPSTNFSYPTNRPLIPKLPGRVDPDSGAIERFGLTPYAFASKFFGVMTADGKSVEATRPSLYNSAGDLGIDAHAMIGSFMIQAGAMQGLASGPEDQNHKKDPYLMTRINFGESGYVSGSLSGLAYWGNETASVPIAVGSGDTAPVDWFRHGVSGNIKYRLLDLYGAIIWDRLGSLPDGLIGAFEKRASGVTIETDYLATDRALFSLRYDRLKAGGLIAEKTVGQVITLQGRYYLLDNFSFYLRDSRNIEKVSGNPLQNFRNLVAFGLDFDF